MTFTAISPPPPDRFRTGDWWRTSTGLLCRVRGATLGLQGYVTLDPLRGAPRYFPAEQVAGFTRQSWGGR
jgi:hypothetical protein